MFWVPLIMAGMSLLDGMNKDRAAKREARTQQSIMDARQALTAKDQAFFQDVIRPGQRNRLSELQKAGLTPEGQAQADALEVEADKTRKALAKSTQVTPGAIAGINMSLAKNKAGLSIADAARKRQEVTQLEQQLGSVPGVTQAQDNALAGQMATSARREAGYQSESNDAYVGALQSFIQMGKGMAQPSQNTQATPVAQPTQNQVAGIGLPGAPTTAWTPGGWRMPGSGGLELGTLRR